MVEQANTRTVTWEAGCGFPPHTVTYVHGSVIKKRPLLPQEEAAEQLAHLLATIEDRLGNDLCFIHIKVTGMRRDQTAPSGASPYGAWLFAVPIEKC